MPSPKKSARLRKFSKRRDREASLGVLVLGDALKCVQFSYGSEAVRCVLGTALR